MQLYTPALVSDAAKKRRDTKKQREAFAKVRLAERQYSAKLRSVANHVARIVRDMMNHSPSDTTQLRKVLQEYADALRPWARAVASSMIVDVKSRDERAWHTYTELMGSELHKQIKDAPIGHVTQQLMAEQVDLITSIPKDAAQRVHDIVTGNLYSGARHTEMLDEILHTGEVTRARARTIARTETTRAASALLQARAIHIGSEGYIWRTMEDALVRPSIALPDKQFNKMNTLSKGSHRKLNGTFHRWDDPPIAGPRGERAHPGAIYNCRCFAEPVLPDWIDEE